MILVTAEAARVQEPAWGRVGGIGVYFTWFGRGSQETIERFIAEGGRSAPDPAPPDPPSE